MPAQNDLPYVSIITVVRNGASYIEKTIQSVLAQTYPNIDFIIIDGQSTDGTLDIVRQYADQLRWISEPDGGIYDAMNKGITMANGEWLNFLNGGDTYYDQNTISRIMDLTGNNSTEFIYGDSINVIEKKARYIRARAISRRSLRRNLGLCHQAVFVKKEFNSMYDLTYRYKAEYNWVIDIIDRISPNGIIHLQMPVVYYALGGFSEQGWINNLREFVLVTYRRYGVVQVILNVPYYLLVLLRAVKYNTIGYAL